MSGFVLFASVTALVLLPSVLIVRALFRSQGMLIDEFCRRQVEFIDNLDDRHIDAAIFLSAAVSLFLELAVIRWQGTTFPLFAFYKNYSLLACFAGLGLGYALARRNSMPLLFTFPVLSVQFVLLMVLRYGLERKTVESLWYTPFTERLNMGVDVTALLPHRVAIYAFLSIVFLLTALAFIPVGQLCGRLMGRRANLKAYGLNLLGSLLGVVLVSAVSFLWTPPVTWFVLSFLVLLAFQAFDIRVLWIGIVGALAAVVVLTWPVQPGIEKIYSPYQILERGPGNGGLSQILAAGHYYQRVHDLSESNANRATEPVLVRAANYYELPYRVFGGAPDDVAIVGAGTGNDVSAALRSHAARIDAIEIDPAIIKLGKMYHPEGPYDLNIVSPIVNDARTHMRTTDDFYDMVVYGMLDSHTLLSHASSVRLDSFVYTVEGISEARERLKEKGIMSLSFWVLSKEIGRKIYLMMTQAFDGKPPVCIQATPTRAVIFLQSRDGGLKVDEQLLMETGFTDVTDYYADPTIQTEVSTDDWPFFYMPKRVYPSSYLGMLLMILIVTVGVTYNFFREKPAFSHVAYFFMGAGFMLVETKAITEMGLAFGNTWHVIGIVIAGILFMAFLANCFVQWLNITKPLVPFVLLIGSLLIGWVISKQGGFGASMGGKLATAAVLTCPMFFSGMVFSALLSKAENIAGVMAVNLIGAMLGGLLEYNSMYFGFRFLYLLAAVLYLLAALSLYKKNGRV